MSDAVKAEKGIMMTIVKVVEVIAQSDQSWEDATRQCLVEASKTLKNIQSIYIKESMATVKDNKIDKYRVIAKVSFIVEE